MAQAHKPGGHGVQARRWSQLRVHLWGMAAHDGAGSRDGGMGSLAQPVVAAHSVRMGYGSP